MSGAPDKDRDLVEKRQLLDADGIERALRRMALEMVERSYKLWGGVEGLLLVGVRTRGVPLAERLARAVAEVERGAAPPVGAVDITLYRDDLFVGLPRPEIGRTELPGDIEGKKVILVDDVLYTGRTIRAALDVLMDYGRPRAVELAVLVDRGRRELPIQPDYTGLFVETTARDSVRVYLNDSDGVDRVALRERKPS